MGRSVGKYIAFFLALTCLLFAAACGKKEEAGGLSYDGIKIEDCVRLGEYRGLSITLDGEDADRGSAVWQAVLERAEILDYPESAVSYYTEQSEARCRYYAKENRVSYEEAMTALGLSEEKISEDARRLVANDLIFRAVVLDAGITLTEDDKTRYFDKYVDKYVENWGYERDYVKNELADLVYDSMLYDKTTEYLIRNNSFLYE